MTISPPTVISLPCPHPGQRAILPKMRRFNVLSCGRRFGKTKLGICRLVPPALEGYPVGWFAPSYKYLHEVWDEFVTRLAPVTARVSKQEQRISLTTGGVVEFWSLKDNPDAGRSRRYKRVAVDEAAKVANLEKAYHEAIRPTLADFRGEADFYSTPKGHDFFWRAFEWGQSPDHAEWISFQLPTSANPYIPPDEIEAARRDLPERIFEQEFLATFLDDGGGVFRGVRESIDAGRKINEPPKDGMNYSAGVDLARIEDFTVIDVVDATGKQVHHERFNRISWERQVAAIAATAKRFKCPVHLDSTGIGDPIHEDIRKAGVSVRPYLFTNASKESLIDNLAIRIERGQARLMDLPTQTAELLAYQYELTPSRNVRMNAPEGMHDDCVIGLALAYWGLGKPDKVRFIQ
jgi:hypothetical protein